MELGKPVNKLIHFHIDTFSEPKTMILRTWNELEEKTDRDLRMEIGDNVNFIIWQLIATPARNLIDNLKREIL